MKANNSNLKVDLYINGELLDTADDRKLISQLAIRDKTVSVSLMGELFYFLERHSNSIVAHGAVQYITKITKIQIKIKY